MKFNFQSLKFKILLAAVWVSVLGMGVLTFLSYNQATNLYQTTLNNQQIQRSRDTALAIGQVIKPLVEIVEATGQRLEALDLKNVSRVDEVLSLIAYGFDAIDNFYFVWQDDGKYTDSANESVSPQVNPRMQSWYLKAIASNKVVVSEPFYHANGKLTLAVVRPVRQMGVLKGVLGLNLHLDKVQEFVSNIKVGQAGFAYLIDKNGYILAYPDKKLIGRNVTSLNDLKASWEIISKKENGDFSYVDSKGTKYFGEFAEVPTIGWKVVLVNDAKEIAGVTRLQLQTAIAIDIITNFLMIVILGFLTYRALKPVEYMVAALNQFSTGDFTVNLSYSGKDEIGIISKTFNDSIHKIKTTFLKVQEHAGKVLAASQQIAAATQQIAQGSQNQAADIQQVTKAIEDLAVAAEKTAFFARNLAEMADDTMISAKSGQQAIIESFKGTNKIAQKVQELEKNIQEINNMLNIITEISDQTNLLALNAAIEAARAGEAGKGFAVVADEVRKLAERSTAAAQEIANAVSGIGQNMKVVFAAVKDGENLSNKAYKSFNEIVEKIEDLNVKSKEISKVSEEQAVLTENISTSTQNIAALAEEVTASVEENSAAAEELAHGAEEMSKQLAQFKI